MRNALFIATVLLWVPVTSLAAFSGLVLSQSPEIARPGENVTVRATVVDRAPASLEYLWSVDGELKKRSVGDATFTTPAPQVGSAISINVEVRDRGMVYAEESLIVRPGGVHLEWEARGSVPPFYIGRSLLAPHTRVVVTAIPNIVTESGELVPKKDLLFGWKVNGVLQSRVGSGTEELSFDLPVLSKPQVVTSIVETRDGSLRAENSVFIPVATQRLVVYEVSPLGGLLDRSAVREAYPFRETEVTLRAYPLYVVNPDESLVSWSLNGSALTAPEEDPYTITFRKTEEGEGSYEVRVGIRGIERFLERASYAFLLQF